AGARAGITVRAAPGGELPPCVHDDPTAARSVLRLGEIIVARDAQSHERVAACADCSVSAVCPGPVRAFATAVGAVARPLDAERGRALAPVSAERARVLSEYRSQLFQTSPEGKLCERRIVRVNFHCNQACDFCFVSRELPAVEHELIVKELEEVAAAGAALDLSGGEPTLHPRLPEYLALGARLGIAEVELQTNAIKMADAAYARELVDAGLRRAFVSLHGTSAAVSDRVTAAPGTFDKTVAGVKQLVALGVTVRLNFVLCGYNVAELADFPDFVARELAGGHGPGPRVGVNLSFVAASTDNVPRDTGLIPRFSDIAWALAAAVERARALGMDLTGLDSKCGVPACYMPAALRERHFAHDIPAEERRLAAPGFTKSEACQRCELDGRCYGIRSTYAELYGTAELRPIVDGEVQPHATPLAAPATLRGTAWAAIGLAPGHGLRPGSVARLVDDAAFGRLARTWVQALAANPDREVVQLGHGLRDLIKIERSTVAAAEETAAAYRARGFSAAVYTGPPGPGGSVRRAIAFVAREPKALDEALAVEPAMTGPHDERAPLVRRMGRLLGYPECCVAAFAAAPEQDDATHVARLARLHPGTLRPEQNWAALPLRPFSHFPCTPTCEATARLGRATLELLAALGPDVGPKLERALGSVALVAAVDRFALLLAPRPDGPGAWTYEEVLSHRNLGTDDAVLRRPAFRAFYLEVVAPLEEGRRVVRTADALVVERDGRRVAAIAFAGGAPPLLDFTGR
ncbi:MAG: radical SAM protein, partial [Myxococcales bacterium]|nr:radical SAM protein [Myxococcales bacterium]